MKKRIDTFWRYRNLLFELVKKGIKLKYRRSYLGIIWSLLEPVMTTIVLTIVFGTLYGNKDHTFPLYILSGRLLYSYFAQGTKVSLKSIRQNSAMIKKVYVPKYLYPLSSVLYNFIIFLISASRHFYRKLSDAALAFDCFSFTGTSDHDVWCGNDSGYDWRVLP